MSTYSSSSRTSAAGGARPKRFSAGQGHVPVPPHSHSGVMPPSAPSSANGQENVRPRHANVQRDAAGWRGEKSQGFARPSHFQQQPASSTRLARGPSAPKESVMARNRHVRAPTAVDPEDAVTVTVSLVDAKFTCLVEKDWPCESLIASAIAEYHLAYPTCEVPDCSVIHHVGRKENLEPRDTVGEWCNDGDEIELLMKDKAMPNVTDQRPPPLDDGLNFHTYDFTVMFHRLPLGFTLRQEMDATVVANIYPKSAGTHYERLVPGAIVVKIGDTPLEFLGLRQVHEVIRHCQLPLLIQFRGWKKPVTKRTSVSGLSDSGVHRTASPRLAPASEPHASLTQRRKSAPAKPPTDLDETASNSRARARAKTDAAAESAEADLHSASETSSQSPLAPSPYSQTRQRLTTERRKTNASSPYPEHKTMAAGRRTAKTARNSPTGELNVPLVDQLDAHSNQGSSPDGSPTSVTDLKLKQKEYHLHGAPLNLNMQGLKGDNKMAGVVDRFASTSIGEPSHEASDLRQCEVDSNQNEEETEEMLVEHIKILQAELTKKHEEAKQLATQLEKYHARLTSVRNKKEKREKRASVVVAERPPSRASTPNLMLTPEVLDAIDTKQGLPAKGNYAGSNASSVSGYSNYSSRSAMAKRHSRQLSRFVGKTGETTGRCDASVSSVNSAYRRERSGSISFGDGLKSPRRQVVQNVNSRYNFMPPKYSSNDNYYEAPSSFSTKGGLISRAKITRDSYIKIPDTPGVGAYDVKLPQERVRGGEIGDSDRSLPWP